MGNRAVIQPEGAKFGIYLHWDGSAESVGAFLKCAKDLGVRDPKADPSYFASRLTQIIANYIGGTTSIGIGDIDSLDTDNGDNGLYVVGADFKVIGRRATPSGEVYAECMARNKAAFAER